MSATEKRQESREESQLHRPAGGELQDDKHGGVTLAQRLKQPGTARTCPEVQAGNEELRRVEPDLQQKHS